MGHFRLSIRLGNDAMQSPRDVARALEAVAERLFRRGYDGEFLKVEGGVIVDDNGNIVGNWMV